MFKRFIPFAYAQNIFVVSPSFFLQLGIKTILVDLDNTLDSYKAHSPRPEAIELKRKLNELGIELIIISNNKAKRVSAYAKKLDVKYLSSTHKPFKKRLLKFLNSNNLNPQTCLLVGDQLLTDVILGKNAHIRVLLCEKIVKEDQWTTHFNRLIDRPIRRYLKKNGKLKPWEEVYE